MSVMGTIRSSGHTNGITARALGTNTICCAQGTRYTVQGTNKQEMPKQKQNKTQPKNNRWMYYWADMANPEY